MIPFDYLLGMPRQPVRIDAKPLSGRTLREIPASPKITLDALLAGDSWVVQLRKDDRP